MTTPKDVGTAVGPTAKPDALEQSLLEKAQTPQERNLAFTLLTQVRQSQMIREAAAAVAEYGWGKDVSPVARAAVARYCLEIGADPVRHVFILGGNVYLNADFYRDLVAANPKFLRDEVDFIHDDPRATDAEKERRRALRVAHGVPEGAPGVAVVTLHYDGRGPFVGVNWAGARPNDPVGKAEPTKAAHSRAYRKAAMKAESAWFGSHPRLRAAEEVLAQGRATFVDEKPVAVIADEGAEIRQIEEQTGPETTDERTVKHNPNAMCGLEGEHYASACALERK